MADCKEIDAALNSLSSKIDGLGNRLNDLERKQKECCEKKEQQSKDNSLEALLRRINAIEKYINQLDNEIILVTSQVGEVGNFFQEMFDIMDSFFEKIYLSINLFTNLFKYFK